MMAELHGPGRAPRLSARHAACLATMGLAACAALPAQQVQVSGALPMPARYAVVRPDAGAADALMPALSACLDQRGFAAGQPATVLVQTAHALRPARAQLVPAGAEPARGGRQPGARRDREELVLAITDRSSGALLWRGAVVQTLRKGEQPGDGSALVAPLCAALRDGRAAGSR